MSQARIEIRIDSPAPSVMADRHPWDADRATDFRVQIVVCDGPGTPERCHEGAVTLCWQGIHPSWMPCRTRQGTPDQWIRGELGQVIADVRRLRDPVAIYAADATRAVLSGSSPEWRLAQPPPETRRGRAGTATPPQLVQATIDLASMLGPSGIIPGDVIRHLNSGRIGAVIRAQPIRSGTWYQTEYLVMPAPPDEPTWWNSRHVRRVTRRDPYRRYLAMRMAEDDPDARARREVRRRDARPHKALLGPVIPQAAWDKAFWRLSNLAHRLPEGGICYADIGREHWQAAAGDCLDRRDRARATVLRNERLPLRSRE